MKIQICDKCSKVFEKYDHTWDVAIGTKSLTLCTECVNELLDWFDQRPIVEVIRERGRS